MYLTNNERRKVIASQEFHRVDAVRSARIYADELARERSRIAMLFRRSMARELERAGCLDGARAIWSQWEGYLDEPAGLRTKAWLDAHRIPLEVIHASGHATVDDLRRLARAFAGKSVGSDPHRTSGTLRWRRSAAPSRTTTENGGTCDDRTSSRSPICVASMTPSSISMSRSRRSWRNCTRRSDAPHPPLPREREGTREGAADRCSLLSGREKAASFPANASREKSRRHTTLPASSATARPRRVEGCGGALDFYYVDRELLALAHGTKTTFLDGRSTSSLRTPTIRRRSSPS